MFSWLRQLRVRPLSGADDAVQSQPVSARQSVEFAGRGGFDVFLRCVGKAEHVCPSICMHGGSLMLLLALQKNDIAYARRSAGKTTKKLKWQGEDLAGLRKAVMKLYGVQDVGSFIQSDCDMGLRLIEGHISSNEGAAERDACQISSASQLYQGCVLEVRNKLWRTLLAYGAMKQGALAVSHRSSGLRQRIYVLMNDQTSSMGAYFISTVINLAILTSTMTYIYSSLPEYRRQYANDPQGVIARGIFWHDAVAAVIFTLELILRIGSLPDLASVRRHPSIFLDLAAVIPWYIYNITGGMIKFFSVLRVARSVRMLLIFSATKRLLLLLGGTAQRAANMLLLLMCIVTMCICVLGVALWAFERGEWDPERRMFVHTASVECPVECPQAAHFGAYAGCQHEGDRIMLNMGNRAHHSLTDCVAIKVSFRLMSSLLMLLRPTLPDVVISTVIHALKGYATVIMLQPAGREPFQQHHNLRMVCHRGHRDGGLWRSDRCHPWRALRRDRRDAAWHSGHRTASHSGRQHVSRNVRQHVYSWAQRHARAGRHRAGTRCRAAATQGRGTAGRQFSGHAAVPHARPLGPDWFRQCAGRAGERRWGSSREQSCFGSSKCCVCGVIASLNTKICAERVLSVAGQQHRSDQHHAWPWEHVPR